MEGKLVNLPECHRQSCREYCLLQTQLIDKQTNQRSKPPTGGGHKSKSRTASGAADLQTHKEIQEVLLVGESIRSTVGAFDTLRK